MIALAIVLLVLGLVFALVEILIPSLGLFTLLCCGSIVASVVIAFGEGATTGIVFIVASFVGLPVSVLLGFWVLRSTRFGSRILLRSPDTRKTVDEIYADNTQLIGKKGITDTPLRPSGMATFDGNRTSVVTEGDMIEKGQPVEVIAVEGNRILVRTVDPDPMEEA